VTSAFHAQQLITKGDHENTRARRHTKRLHETHETTKAHETRLNTDEQRNGGAPDGFGGTARKAGRRARAEADKTRAYGEIPATARVSSISTRAAARGARRTGSHALL
jgi:hypothetical protein